MSQIHIERIPGTLTLPFRSRPGRRFFLPAVSALLVQVACQVSPNDTAPKPAGAPVNVSVANPPLAEWWTPLKDPQLERLLQRAEAQSLDCRVAAARVGESRVRLGLGPGDPRPDRNARSSHAAEASSLGRPEGAGTTTECWQQGFDATWEIPQFAGQGREGTTAGLSTPGDERSDAMVSLLAEVARDYFQLRSLQQRSDLAIDTVVIQGRILELTRSLSGHGLATDLDCSRTQARLGQTLARMVPIQAGIHAAEHSIATLLGQAPGALAAELAPHSPLPAVPSLATGLSSHLLRRRPDVRQAERWVEATQAGTAARVASRFPTFMLTGNFAHDSARFSTALAVTDRSIAGGPGEPFEFSQTAALGLQETGTHDKRIVIYKYVLLSALRDVEEALTAYRKGQEQDTCLVRAEASADQALEASRNRYQLGTADFLEVLEAEQELLLSQAELVESRQTSASNLVALYKTLGGGKGNPSAQETR